MAGKYRKDGNDADGWERVAVTVLVRKGFLYTPITNSDGSISFELRSRNNPGIWVTLDADDFERVSLIKWHPFHCKGTTYASGNVKVDGVWKTRFLLHRFITDADKGLEVDHKDRDGLNNRRSNLRIATKSQNMTNMKRSYGSSRFTGVSWSNAVGKWTAYVGKDRKQIYLGCFSSEEEAARVRDAAAKAIQGEFAYLNFSEGAVSA